MVGVIILSTEAASERAQQIAENFRAGGLTDTKIVDVSSGATLPDIVAGTSARSVLLVDSTLPLSALSNMSAALRSLPAAGISIFSIVGESDNDRLPEFRTDTIVSALSHQESWPIAGFYCDSATLRNLGQVHASSARELFMVLITLALAESHTIDEVPIMSSESFESTPSGEERARVLQAAINACNVEELFPNHAWRLHQEESAAACYHTVAALFIRFGDIEAANQALTLSDNFEDSPRSLALKSLIANIRGEALGAVANMVASLQQYELRKYTSDKHYLSFTPSNLERINEELRAGLQALNKQDNSTALVHFSEAVFNFDPFYRQWGVATRVN